MYAESLISNAELHVASKNATPHMNSSIYQIVIGVSGKDEGRESENMISGGIRRTRQASTCCAHSPIDVPRPTTVLTRVEMEAVPLSHLAERP